MKGDGTTNIELNSKNTLKGGESNTSGHAGLEKSTNGGNGTPIIKDGKNDDCTVKSDEQKAQETEEGTGASLTATGENGAAGIGDGWSNHDNTVNVTITGGTVTAIGGGQYEGGDDPVINVKIDSSNKSLKVVAKVTGSGAGAIGKGTKEGKDPDSGADLDTITADSLGEDHGALVQFYNNYDETTGEGTLPGSRDPGRAHS